MIPTLHDHAYHVGVLGEKTICAIGWSLAQGKGPNTIGMYDDTHLDVIKPLTLLFPLVVYLPCDFILGHFSLCGLMLPSYFDFGVLALDYLRTYVDHGQVSRSSEE